MAMKGFSFRCSPINLAGSKEGTVRGAIPSQHH